MELGCWKGKSTHALASGCPGIVTAVDTWLGSDNPEDDQREMARLERPFEAFLRNLSGFRVVTYVGTTRQAASHYAAWGRSFDMVYIDANHTYEHIAQDIRMWLPLAKKLICGHDYSFKPEHAWMGVRRAVDELVPKPVEIHNTIWAHWIQV